MCYLMPLINMREAVSLDHLMQKAIRKKLKLSEKYAYRIFAAYNVASMVTSLHKCGHYIVDLKPSNVSVYKENTNLAIYWADRVYDGGNLSFCNNSFLENANSLVFICGIDVWNVSNEIFRSIGNGSLVLCPSSGCGCIGICL